MTRTTANLRQRHAKALRFPELLAGAAEALQTLRAAYARAYGWSPSQVPVETALGLLQDYVRDMRGAKIPNRGVPGDALGKEVSDATRKR